MADGWSGAAQGLQGGLQMGLGLGFQIQNQQLAERKQKLAEYDEFFKIADYARSDPGTGESLFKDWAARNKLTPDETKDRWNELVKTSEQSYSSFKKMVVEAGVAEPDTPTMREVIKMSPLDKMKWIESRQGMAAQSMAAKAFSGLGGEATQPAAQPAAPGAPAPAPGTPPAAAPQATPVSAPATGAPAAPAAAAGDITAGLKLAPITPLAGGQAVPFAPGQISPIVARNIQAAQKYTQVADQLEASNNPAAVKKAQEYREMGKKLEDAAWVGMTPQQAKARGYESGAVVFYNPISGGEKVTQAGHETERVAGEQEAKSILGTAYKQGDRLVVSSRGGVKFLREGKDVLETLDPSSDLGKKLKLNPDAIVQKNPVTQELYVREKGTGQFSVFSLADQVAKGYPVDEIWGAGPSGKPEQVMAARDQIVPVTDEMRAKLKAQGVNLDQGNYWINMKTGAYGKIGEPAETWQTLTPQQIKDANLLPGRAYQQQLTGKSPGEVKQIGSETERPAWEREQAKISGDFKATVMSAGDAADQRLRNIEIQKIALDNPQLRTGSNLAEWRQSAGQLFSALGLEDWSKEMGTASSEVFSSLAKRGLTAITQEMKGQQSDKELKTAADSAEGLLKTKEGNRLILDIAAVAERNKARKRDALDEWGNPDEKKDGKTFRQFWKTQQEDLTPELRDRINNITKQGPDKVSGWSQPISAMDQTQLHELSLRDDLTAGQKSRIAARARELMQTGTP